MQTLTQDQQRNAALDMQTILTNNSALAQKYPQGSTFTVIGLSTDNQAIVYIERPDNTDAVERVPTQGFEHLRSAATGVTNRGNATN